MQFYKSFLLYLEYNKKLIHFSFIVVLYKLYMTNLYMNIT